MFCRSSDVLDLVFHFESQKCQKNERLNRCLTTGGRDFVLFLSVEYAPDNNNNN